MQDLDYYTYNQAKDMAPTSPSDLVPRECSFLDSINWLDGDKDWNRKVMFYCRKLSIN